MEESELALNWASKCTSQLLSLSLMSLLDLVGLSVISPRTDAVVHLQPDKSWVFFKPSLLCTAKNAHWHTWWNLCYEIQLCSTFPVKTTLGFEGDISWIMDNMVWPPTPWVGAIWLPMKSQLCCMHFISTSTFKKLTATLPHRYNTSLFPTCRGQLNQTQGYQEANKNYQKSNPLEKMFTWQ